MRERPFETSEKASQRRALKVNRTAASRSRLNRAQAGNCDRREAPEYWQNERGREEERRASSAHPTHGTARNLQGLAEDHFAIHAEDQMLRHSSLLHRSPSWIFFEHGDVELLPIGMGLRPEF